ncbi:MAG: DUF1461 domain-containing protein [archaeon]
MKVKIIALISFLSVLLSFILFCSVFFSVLFDLNYYKSEYVKYNLTKFSMESLAYETNNLFGFFKGTAQLDSDYFSKNEILHLNDVKVLVYKVFILYVCSIAAFICLIILLFKLKLSKKLFLRCLARITIAAGAIGLSCIIIGLIFYKAIGFDFLFSKFHEIFFVGNYSFDPAISNMKYMFPDEFFYDISIRIVLIYAVVLILSLAYGTALYFVLKRPHSKNSIKTPIIRSPNLKSRSR